MKTELLSATRQAAGGNAGQLRPHSQALLTEHPVYPITTITTISRAACITLELLQQAGTDPNQSVGSSRLAMLPCEAPEMGAGALPTPTYSDPSSTEQSQ